MIYDAIQKTHQKCFLCGNENPWSLGLKFQIANDGWIYSEFQAHEKLQGYDGILHGGIVASLLDSAMTHCLFYHGIKALTGELVVRFLRPISYNANLKIRAYLVFEKSPLYIVKAEIMHNDKIMARAKAKFINIKL